MLAAGQDTALTAHFRRLKGYQTTFFVEESFGVTPKPSLAAQGAFVVTPKPSLATQGAFVVTPKPSLVTQDAFGMTPKPSLATQDTFGVFPPVLGYLALPVQIAFKPLWHCLLAILCIAGAYRSFFYTLR